MQPQSEAAKDSELTLGQRVSAVLAAICIALIVFLASWIGIAHLPVPPTVMALLFFVASPILAIFVYLRSVRFLLAAMRFLVANRNSAGNQPTWLRPVWNSSGKLNLPRLPRLQAMRTLSKVPIFQRFAR